MVEILFGLLATGFWVGGMACLVTVSVDLGFHGRNVTKDVTFMPRLVGGATLCFWGFGIIFVLEAV